MNRYQRRLPHWDAVGQRTFVTFRLDGSIPKGRPFPPATVASGKGFLAMDRILDKAESGPKFLNIPEVANIVIAALHDGQNRFKRYDLHSYVVMPNHVHLLVTPHVQSREWLRSLKGYTGNQISKLLNRPGPIWQVESYDHLIRNEQEFSDTVGYIEWNPVQAGLVSLPEDFPFSSSTPGGSPALHGSSISRRMSDKTENTERVSDGLGMR